MCRLLMTTGWAPPFSDSEGQIGSACAPELLCLWVPDDPRAPPQVQTNQATRAKWKGRDRGKRRDAVGGSEDDQVAMSNFFASPSLRCAFVVQPLGDP